MPSPLKEQWDEFDWEQELRKDDARISAYFAELPRYIDLPAEDEIIYKNIQRQKALTPAGGVWPFRQPEDPSRQPPEDGVSEEERRRWDEEWIKREGAGPYIICCRLTRKISTLFSLRTTAGDTAQKLVRILTLTGRTMARLTDLIEMDPGDMPALRIALSKRFIADANEMLGILETITGAGEEGNAIIDVARIDLFGLRDAALEIQNNARNGVSL